MFIGQQVFTRGADIREYRLFLLIEQPFDAHIPDEQRVYQRSCGERMLRSAGA